MNVTIILLLNISILYIESYSVNFNSFKNIYFSDAVMPEDIQHIYLDSCVIIGYIKESDEMHRVSNRIVHRINNMLKNRTITVHLSSLALSEVYKEITDEDMFYRFCDFVKMVPYNYEGIDFDTMRTALEIEEIDKHIEPQDALITASAINDPYSTRFITYDSNILYSEKLREYVNSRERYQKLRFASEI